MTTLVERTQEILKHMETAAANMVEADYAAAEAAVHSELAKVEAAVLGLVAKVKAEAQNVKNKL